MIRKRDNRSTYWIRVRLLSVAAVAVLLTVAIFLVRPKHDAVGGLQGLGSWIFDGRQSDLVKLYEGTDALSQNQASGVIAIVRQHLSGVTLMSTEVERRGPEMANLICRTRTADGKEAIFSVAGLDGDRGAGVPVRRLMERAWEFELLCKLGRYPQERGATLPYLATGAESDGPKLSALGLTGCTSPSGTWMTWEELARWYRTREGTMNAD